MFIRHYISMAPRKFLIPNRVGRLSSEFNYEVNNSFPKSTEKQSVVSWSSPGKSAVGASVSGGTYRNIVIRRQFGTR
jgi:hypothetical protein